MILEGKVGGSGKKHLGFGHVPRIRRNVTVTQAAWAGAGHPGARSASLVLGRDKYKEGIGLDGLWKSL